MLRHLLSVSLSNGARHVGARTTATHIKRQRGFSSAVRPSHATSTAKLGVAAFGITTLIAGTTWMLWPKEEEAMERSGNEKEQEEIAVQTNEMKFSDGLKVGNDREKEQISKSSTEKVQEEAINKAESSEKSNQLYSKEEEDTVMTSQFCYFTGKGLADPNAVRVFSGSGNLPLAKDIARYLQTPLGDMTVSRFADGEVNIKVNENVRGKHVVLIQSCSPPYVNDSLMELLLMISTMRRSSAKTITVVMPYCPYTRSDIKSQGRVPIAARDMMEMLETMGMDRLVVMDMHSSQTQGFLSPSVPSDNMSAIKVGALYMSEMEEINEAKNIVVVAPNAKAVNRAKDFWNVLLQRQIPARFAMVIRKPALGDIERKEKGLDVGPDIDDTVDQIKKFTDDYEVVGDDNVQGSVAIVVDDIVDSANNLCATSDALKAAGAEKVLAFVTHGLFTGRSIEVLTNSGLDRVLVTNTAICSKDAQTHPKVQRISVAPLLAETIRCLCEKETLSPLFSLPKAKSA